MDQQTLIQEELDLLQSAIDRFVRSHGFSEWWYIRVSHSHRKNRGLIVTIDDKNIQPDR